MNVYRSMLTKTVWAVLFGLILSPFNSALADVDHSLWGELLTQHNHNGRVDYKELQADEAKLNTYLGQLEKVDPKTLERSDALAYYINLYNAWTVKLILSQYPNLKSIKDIGTLLKSPWKIDLIPLNGKRVTLDHIEHEIIRPQFNDARIHFAVNCAALSCPPLWRAPFEGHTLDAQLEQATTQFINDPKSNYLKGDTLFISRIFKWFKKDFKNDVAGFIRRYAQGDLKTALDTNKGTLSVKYSDYNWNLNKKQ